MEQWLQYIEEMPQIPGQTWMYLWGMSLNDIVYCYSLSGEKFAMKDADNKRQVQLLKAVIVNAVNNGFYFPGLRVYDGAYH